MEVDDLPLDIKRKNVTKVVLINRNLEINEL